MPGGLKYWVAYEACGKSVPLMYGALLLPWIWDQLWFSIRMMKTVRIALGPASGAPDSAPASVPASGVPVSGPASTAAASVPASLGTLCLSTSWFGDRPRSPGACASLDEQPNGQHPSTSNVPA